MGAVLFHTVFAEYVQAWHKLVHIDHAPVTTANTTVEDDQTVRAHHSLTQWFVSESHKVSELAEM